MDCIPWPRSGATLCPYVSHMQKVSLSLGCSTPPLETVSPSRKQFKIHWSGEKVCVTKHTAKFKIYGIRELWAMKASIHMKKFPLKSQFRDLSYLFCALKSVEVVWTGTCKGTCQLLQV